MHSSCHERRNNRANRPRNGDLRSVSSTPVISVSSDEGSNAQDQHGNLGEPSVHDPGHPTATQAPGSAVPHAAAGPVAEQHRRRWGWAAHESKHHRRRVFHGHPDVPGREVNALLRTSSTCRLFVVRLTRCACVRVPARSRRPAWPLFERYFARLLMHRTALIAALTLRCVICTRPGPVSHGDGPHHGPVEAPARLPHDRPQGPSSVIVLFFAMQTRWLTRCRADVGRAGRRQQGRGVARQRAQFHPQLQRLHVPR